MVLILASATGAFYAFLAGAPVVLKHYGIGPERIGLVIMCVPFSYIVGNFLTSRLARVRGQAWLMNRGQAFTLGGLVLLVGLALAGQQSVLAFTLPLMLLGLGHGLMLPTTLAATVSLVPALAGAAAAVAGVTQQLMGAVGGFVVGLVPHQGALNLGWLMLAFSALGLVAHLRMGRQALPEGEAPTLPTARGAAD